MSAAWPGRGRSDRDALAGLLLAPLVVLGAVVGGLGAGFLATGSKPVLALVFPLLLVPVLVWCRPEAGLVIVFVGALTVEQFEYMVGPRAGAVTAKIPFFSSLVPGAGISAVELLLALLALIWVMKGVQERRRLVHRTPLGTRMALVAGLAVLYLALGLARGGSLRDGLWEVRPFLYLVAAYFLAASLLTTARAVRVLLWSVVIGCTLKAAYGVTIWWSVRHVEPRPEAVLAHEESFFFGLFVFITLGLWMYDVRGALRRVATVALPLVLLADMVNSRRTAWAILICGCLVLGVVGYVKTPHRRHVLRRLGAAGLVVSAIYFPAFWTSEGTLAQPARAVRSVIAPDARDDMSNEYRYVEDANLILNIQMSNSRGAGFGIPIVYYIPLVDLSDSSFVAFVPHNGIYYIWLRMGILGEIVFWLFIAEAVLAASRLAGARDRETALLGAVAVAMMMAYLIIGHKDMGFNWFRIAFAVGVVLGVVEARARSLTGEAISPTSPAVLRPGVRALTAVGGAGPS